MAGPRPLGPLIHSFFADHLITVKGLRPASVRSYRDTIRLLLCFAASDKHAAISEAGSCVIDARSGERCASCRCSALRIKNLRNGNEISGAVASTDDHYQPIG